MVQFFPLIPKIQGDPSSPVIFNIVAAGILDLCIKGKEGIKVVKELFVAFFNYVDDFKLIETQINRLKNTFIRFGYCALLFGLEVSETKTIFLSSDDVIESINVNGVVYVNSGRYHFFKFLGVCSNLEK